MSTESKNKNQPSTLNKVPNAKHNSEHTDKIYHESKGDDAAGKLYSAEQKKIEATQLKADQTSAKNIACTKFQDKAKGIDAQDSTQNRKPATDPKSITAGKAATTTGSNKKQ